MKGKFYISMMALCALAMAGCSEDTTKNDIPVCGDHVCSGDETVKTCPEDCNNSKCGNGACDNGETSESCPLDCKPNAVCGNGICESSETTSSCPQDCKIPVCGDGKCDAPETENSCPQDCRTGLDLTCGNGICESGENADNCSNDCFCGNNVCEPTESTATCPGDCPEPMRCGDAKCNGSETRQNCPADCPPVCGDGKCEGGEHPDSCPQDCESALSGEEDAVVPVCGDGICDAGEEKTCKDDCKIEENLKQVNMAEFNAMKEPVNRFLFDYDLAIPETQEKNIENFFAFPYPSELRTDQYGRPNIKNYPLPDMSVLESLGEIIKSLKTLIPSLVERTQTERAGFPPIGAVYFRSSVPVSNESIMANAHQDDLAKTAQPDSCFQIINVEEGSKHYGERVPVYVTYHRQTDTIWAKDTLVMRPVPGVGPHPGDRHVAVVTDCLRTKNKRVINQSNKLRHILAQAAPLAINTKMNYYVSQLKKLEEAGKLGFDISQIRAMTGYDTSQVADEMMQMADALKGKGRIVADKNGVALPADDSKTESGWTSYNKASVFRGQFVTCNFIEGDYSERIPNYEIPGAGEIRFDKSGNLKSECREEKIYYEITVPKAKMPANGYPIAIYGHGTGGSAKTHARYVGSEGLVLIDSGVNTAMIGFDACLQGNRTKGSGQESDLYGVMLSNPVIIRESVRQTVNDMLVLYDIIKDKKLILPPRPGSKENVIFDPSYGFYMGHSQGSQEAGLLLAVTDQVKNAFLSAGGGGVLVSFVDLKPDLSGIPGISAMLKDKSIADMLSMLFGLPDKAISYDTFLTNHIVQPLMDPVDPLNFAPHFIKDPLPGMNSKNIAQTVGLGDYSTPTGTQYAMIAATGLPFIGEVFEEAPAIKILGLGKSRGSSVKDNITTDQGNVTGAAMQFNYTGKDNPHFVIYNMKSARDAYLNFFKSAINGSTTVSVSGEQKGGETI